MTARLFRDYIGTDGKEATVEVDRGPEIVTLRSSQNLTVGQVVQYDDGMYRLVARERDVQSTLRELCPAPFCHAPVTHRSLHDIPGGRYEDWTDEEKTRWAEVGK